jgi:hypothetical protein
MRCCLAAALFFNLDHPGLGLLFLALAAPGLYGDARGTLRIFRETRAARRGSSAKGRRT